MNIKILFILIIPVHFILSQDVNYNKYLSTVQSFLGWETVQSIDFDDLGRVIFGLSRVDEQNASLVRYTEGNWEEWNLTGLFNLDFEFIITDIDHNGNLLALQREKLFKFDGLNWTNTILPNVTGGVRYAHLSEDTKNNIWISIYLYGLGAVLLKVNDSTITDYTSYFPIKPSIGELYFEGDSVWICTTEGLGLLYNDQLNLIDPGNSAIPTKYLYSFHIDSEGTRWIGSADKGLIKWIDDSTFISYNSYNTPLISDFVNAIAESSDSTLWLATDIGFASFKDGQVVAYPFGERSVIAIEIDKNELIWLGTNYDGLFVFDGDTTQYITSVNDITDFPIEFKLYQNYPNPFNPVTTLKYDLPNTSDVTLVIYDILGRKVKELVNTKQQAGRFEIQFNATNLASGVYIYQLIADNPSTSSGQGFISSKKMILLK
jgi:hypothetical protein